MKRGTMFLLCLAVLLLAVACQDNKPDYAGMAAVSYAEAEANKGKAEVVKAEAEKANAEARTSEARAAQAQAGVNAEYADTMKEAIDGLVTVAETSNARLTLLILLPWGMLGAVVLLIAAGAVVGVMFLRYHTAQVRAFTALIEYRAAGQVGPGDRDVLLIRPGVRAERLTEGGDS